MAKKSIDEMLGKTGTQKQPEKAEEKVVEGTTPPVEQVEPAKEGEQNGADGTSETHKEEVTAGTGDSPEINELADGKPTETGQPPVELTDGTSEKAEDHKKTAPKTPQKQPEKAEEKVVVVYVGGGTWRDEKGCVWANEDNGRIKKSRQYKKSEYDKRKDLQFMVKYKSMTATVVE